MLVKEHFSGVTGRIQTRSYDNQQGQRVYVTEVVATTSNCWKVVLHLKIANKAADSKVLVNQLADLAETITLIKHLNHPTVCLISTVILLTHSAQVQRSTFQTMIYHSKRI